MVTAVSAAREAELFHNPSAPTLLSLWEHSWNRDPAYRALALLGSFLPDRGTESLGRLSIGRRDGLLLALRERLFGSRLVSLVDCPACPWRIELSFPVQQIQILAPEEALCEQPTSLLEQDGYRVRFRPPDSNDLLALSAGGEKQSLHDRLLALCVLEVSHEGRPCSAADLPQSLCLALERRLDELDPQADVRLEVSCADCGHGWEVVFDIAAYLLEEFDRWAHSTLAEVHLLASAYCWTESVVLALSPIRRRYYLDLVRQ